MQDAIAGMNVVILGSGSGTNAEAILTAQANGQLAAAQVVAVYSDSEGAGILERAARFGVKAQYLSAAPYKTKLEGDAERAWIEAIASEEPDLLVLAGFMRVLKPAFLQAFAGKIINLHPSLLPAFPGLDAIRRSFERGVKVTGCTVHWVNEEVDGGAIIEQGPVRVMPGDTLDLLEQKVHAVEHFILPKVVGDLSAGMIPFPASG